MDEFEKDEYEEYLKELLAQCLANGFEEQAEIVRKVLAQRKEILSERKALLKRLDALPPSWKNYVDKVKKSREISAKLTNGLTRVGDPELRSFLTSTFTEYIEANNNVTTEFLTLLELRRMDDLEHLVKPNKQ